MTMRLLHACRNRFGRFGDVIVVAAVQYFPKQRIGCQRLLIAVSRRNLGSRSVNSKATSRLAPSDTV